MLVYLITSPSNKHYVGITSRSLKRRMTEHRTASKRCSKSALYRAARKYGWENMTCKVVDRTELWEDLCVLEKKHIQAYNSFKNGYNNTLGGEGMLGVWLGRTHTEESKLKMSESSKGKKLSEKHKEAISKGLEGRVYLRDMTFYTEDYKLKMAISKGSSNFIVYKDGKEIGRWINQAKCARDLDLNKSMISYCLRGIYKQHKGYSFKHEHS